MDNNFYASFINPSVTCDTSSPVRSDYPTHGVTQPGFVNTIGDEEFFTPVNSRSVKSEKHTTKPQWGWRRIVSKTVFPWISKSVDERTFEESQALLNCTLQSPGVIAVVSHKGGVGKTTLAVLYANMIAVNRKIGKVLLIEATPGGTLAQRVTATPGNTKNLRSLQNQVNTVSVDGKQISTSEMFSFLLHNQRSVSALMWDPNPTHEPITGKELEGIIERFSQEFDVIIVDCESRVNSDITLAAVTRANSIIAVGDNTSSGMKGLLSYLGWQNHVFPAKNAVTTLFVNYRSHNPYFDATAMQQGLKKRGFDHSIFIPQEDHLTSDSVIDIDAFPQRIRNMFVRHAAHVFSHLISTTPHGIQ